MADTQLPLRKWLFAFHIIGASKKGVSALQLSRMIGVKYQTAWHLCHRIRATMTKNDQIFSGIVETDEMYAGGVRRGHGKGYVANKASIATIIQRNSEDQHDSQAQTTAFPHEKVDGRTLGPNLQKHTIPSETVLMTDTSPIYNRVGKGFSDHHTVNHKAKEYVRQDADGHLATTNTAEGYFANLRRKIDGTHHHVSKKHLQKYLEEQDHGYNHRTKTAVERTEAAISAIEGKRLYLHKPASGSGESLFDGKRNELRRKPKRPVKKTKSTKDAPAARAPMATPVPRRTAAQAPANPAPAPVVPRTPAPPTSIMWGRELPRVPPKKPAGK